MAGKMKKAINFDLDTKKLKEEKRICNDNVSEVQYDPESDFGR